MKPVGENDITGGGGVRTSVGIRHGIHIDGTVAGTRNGIVTRIYRYKLAIPPEVSETEPVIVLQTNNPLNPLRRSGYQQVGLGYRYREHPERPLHPSQGRRDVSLPAKPEGLKAIARVGGHTVKRPVG